MERASRYARPRVTNGEYSGITTPPPDADVHSSGGPLVTIHQVSPAPFFLRPPFPAARFYFMARVRGRGGAYQNDEPQCSARKRTDGGDGDAEAFVTFTVVWQPLAQTARAAMLETGALPRHHFGMAFFYGRV